jgi:hypothetical protein
MALEPTPTLHKHNLTGRVVLLIAICAAIAVIPMFLFGYRADSHDLGAHMASWMEAAQQFRQFILIPRWAVAANYGFGEPRFIFYPPLSWMLGGVLGLFLPWKFVPAVYVWLTFTTAGAAMWKCAREWLPPPQAAMAAVLFALNPYALTTAYMRCAYAELLASAFFPLLVWAVLRPGTSARKQIAILATILAAIWLVNYPAGVIATYSLVVLLLVLWASFHSWRTALFGVGSILLALGLDAWVLLPATWETKWIEINAVIPSKSLPWHNFIFTKDNTAVMIEFNRKISFLAAVLICVTVVAIPLSRRLREKHLAAWSSLSVLGGVSIFMMLPLSLLLWRYLPALRFVQFPWRWLFPLALSFSVLTTAVLTQQRRNWFAWLAVGCALFVFDGRIVLTKQPRTTRTITDLDSAMRSGTGYEGLPEYAPVGSRPTRLSKDAPRIVAVGDENSISRKLQVETWSPERKLVSVDSPEPFDVDLKLLAYPSWRAKLNEGDIDVGTNPDTGQIRMHVPAGSNRIDIFWRSPWDVTAGNVVSLLAIIILIFLSIGPATVPTYVAGKTFQ